MRAKKLLFNGVVRLTIALLLFVAGVSNTVFAQATIQTDKPDYLPGELVIISGAEWMADETITLNIQHMVYTSHPDETWTTVANAAGLVYDANYFIDPWDLGETFLLTATGQTSGYIASTTFTDGNAADGEGAMTVNPIFTCNGGTIPTFTFKGPGGNKWNPGSKLTLDVPWSVTSNNISTNTPVNNPVIGTITTAASTMGTLITIPFYSTTNAPGFNIMISGVTMSADAYYDIPVKTAQAGGTLTSIALPPFIVSSSTADGYIAGSLNSCSNISNGSLTLIGNTGQIIEWQQSTLIDIITDQWTAWQSINGQGNQQSLNLNGNISTTTRYRVHTSGGCNGSTYSSIAMLAVVTAPAIVAADITDYTVFPLVVDLNEHVHVYSIVPLISTKYYINYNTVNQQEIFSPYTFPGGSTTVTTVAQNSCSTSTDSFVVTTGTPPEFTACPGNITASTDLNTCSAVVNYTASASGMPAPTLSYAFTGALTETGTGTGSGSTFPKGVTNVTITATNGIAPDATCSFTVTVEDHQVPTFTRPDDITIYTNSTCEYDASLGVTGDVTNETDNCATEIEAEYSDEVADGTCTGSHIITRTWTLSDGNGNSADPQVQTITVLDIIDPTFSAPIDITIFTDADCNYNAGVGITGDVTNEADNCTQTLEANFTDAIVDGDCEGSHIITRTWRLEDDCGNVTTHDQTITVLDDIDPTFTVPDNATIYTDADCNYNAGVDITGDVTNEADNCTQTLEANFTDAIVDGDCEGSHIITRTWRLEDDCGNVTTHDQTITVLDDIDPTFTVPDDATIYTDADCNYNASVGITGDVTNEADNCTQTLEANFTDAIVDGDCEGSHIITRTWRLEDDCGNVTTHDQTITVLDDIDPTFTVPDDATIYTDADCNYNASVTATGDVEDEADNCSTGLNATFADAAPVALVGCEGGYTITRTWSLVDNCGNAAEDQVQTITVSDNIPPTFNAPEDITIFTNADCNYNASVTATGDVEDEADNCSTGLNATFADAAPVALVGCEGGYTIERTWSLVDNCGNAAEDQVQTITVSDNIPPTFNAPADITIFTDADCNYDSGVGATGDVEDEADNCSTDIEATFADADPVALDGCEGGYTITRTWSLIDNCGNAAEDQVQTITVSDNIPPTFTAPEDATILTGVNCTYDISVDETGDVINEHDNCSTGLQATYVDSEPVPGGCDSYLTITRTWSLVDNCDNPAEDQTQLITVKIPTTVDVYTSAVQARYYDDLTLYAEVGANCYIAPVEGEDQVLTGIVEFFVDGESVGTANAYPIPEGEEGYMEHKLRATLIHKLVEMPGDHVVTAIFTPDCNAYVGADSQEPAPEFTVYARDASPLSAKFYTGPLYTWTTGPNTSTATVILTAVIKDESTPIGDVRGARVTFYYMNNGVPSPIPSAQNLPVNLIEMTDGTVGAASAIVQFNIGNWNALDFDIAVGISGGYTNAIQDPESRSTITVSKPVGGGYIMGGGQFANTANTSGLIRGAMGEGNNTEYSLNVKYNKKGTNPQGAVSLTIYSWYDANGLLDSQRHTYHVKSNAIATLMVNSPNEPNAYFSAKATLKEEVDGNMISIEGNNILQIWMTDIGNDGGTNGKIGIQLNRKAGGIWYSSYWNGSATEEQNIFSTTQPVTVASELKVAPSSAVKTSEIDVETIQGSTNEAELIVYPNPTNSKATFRVVPQSDSKARLELYNLNGSSVQVLFEGNVTAGQTYEINYQPSDRQVGMLLYRLILDGKVLNGKLLIQH